MVQWLRLYTSTSGGMGLIPDWGTKILHAMQCSQKKLKTDKTKHKPIKTPLQTIRFLQNVWSPTKQNPTALCSVLTCQTHPPLWDWCQCTLLSALTTQHLSAATFPGLSGWLTFGPHSKYFKPASALLKPSFSTLSNPSSIFPRERESIRQEIP